MTNTRAFPCPDLQHTRLRPDHLLSATAHLVGFQPTDSLVCIFIGADHHLTVTGRLDWELCRIDPGSCAEALAVPGRNAGSEFAFLAVVDPQHEDDGVLTAVRDRFEDLAIEVIWAGTLQGDVWRGQYCQDAGCPEHRIDRTAPAPILTTLIAEGSAPLADRASIVAEVARSEGDVVTFAQVGEAGPGADLEGWRDTTVDRVMDLLADPAPLEPGAVALVCAACQDLRVRDVVLWRLTVGPEHLTIGWRRAWEVVSETLRRSPLSHLAPVGAVAALVAWQLGDGARAQECLERAREGNPGHSLTRLMGQCVDSGAPPTVWQAAMASMDEATCRHGEDRTPAAPVRRRRSRSRKAG